MSSTCLPALSGVLQNDAATAVIDNPPLFDLLQRSKAAEADKVVVEAAIAYTRRFGGTVHITPLTWNAIAEGVELDHIASRESEQCITTALRRHS